MGLTDLELWKKERGMNHKWERVVLPRNLPPIDIYSPVSIHLPHLVDLWAMLGNKEGSHQAVNQVRSRAKQPNRMVLRGTRSRPGVT